MIRYHQHIPAFVDGVDPKSGTVDTQAELLALPFVKHWSDLRDFSRWSCASNGPGDYALMAERKDGAFYVVALLDTEPDLPKWSAPERSEP